MPLKDSQYWREYNQKRKKYLALKARERRAKEKGSMQPAEKIESIQPNSIQLSQSIQPEVRIQPTNSERIQPKKVVDRIQPIEPSIQPITKDRIQPQPDSIQPKLWANYYRTKKPYCWRCDYSGIKATEYAYCSEAKVYDPTFKKYFDQCLIKHWEKHNQMERIN